MRTIPKVFRLLSRSLDDLLSRRNQFCLHPGTDFTRSRKLPLRSLLLFLISMDDKSLRDELVQFFHLPSSTPSRSAVVQQRKNYRPLLWHAFCVLLTTILIDFISNRRVGDFISLPVMGLILHLSLIPRMPIPSFM